MDGESANSRAEGQMEQYGEDQNKLSGGAGTKGNSKQWVILGRKWSEQASKPGGG